MPECPNCLALAKNPNREWYYKNNYFLVQEFVCSKCGLEFRGYYHNEKLSHTIPKNRLAVTELKIKKYLRTVGCASEEQIAEALNLNIAEVKTALSDLAKRELAEEDSLNLEIRKSPQIT